MNYLFNRSLDNQMDDEMSFWNSNVEVEVCASVCCVMDNLTIETKSKTNPGLPCKTEGVSEKETWEQKKV